MVVRRFFLSVLAAMVLAGCDAKLPSDGQFEPVTLGGRTFMLELAIGNESRRVGLGGRSSIAADGGMLFVFPEARRRNFWMADCIMDIDIAFVDPLGHVTAIHTMPMEPPQGVTETLDAYEDRLARYPSRFPSQYVIELQPGMFATLGIKVGARLPLDLDRLKALAKSSDIPLFLP